MNKTSAGSIREVQPQDINIKQSSLHLTSPRAVVYQKSVKKDCFLLPQHYGNVSQVLMLLYEFAAAYLIPLFSATTVSWSFWTWNDQFGSREPVINELMVEIPVFPLLCCKGAETASDSLSFKPAAQLWEKRLISVHQYVCGCGRSWHSAQRFLDFMVRTPCEKGARQNMFMRTCLATTVHQGQI